MATRSQVETATVARVYGLLQLAGMSIADISNTDLNDPLSRALIGMGYTASYINPVSDADLSAVELGEFLNWVELYTLENIAGRLVFVDTKVGPRDEKLSQNIQHVEKRIERLREQLSGITSAGVITTVFQERD